MLNVYRSWIPAVLLAAVFLGTLFLYNHSLDEKGSHERVQVFNALNDDDKLIFVRNLMDQEGIISAWKLFDAAGVPGVGPLPYHVGSYIYSKHGASGIKLCPPEYWLGCRGGLLKAAVAAEGLTVMKDLEEECNVDGLGFRCGHGLGHGFSQFTGFDIKKALSHCDALSLNSQRPCFGGVFQEYWEFAPEDKFLSAGVWDMCRDLGGAHLSVCAFNLRDLWESRYQLDFHESMGLCLSTDDRTIRLSCLLGVGFDIVKKSGGQAKEIIEKCREVFPADYEPLCLVSASNVLAVYTYTGWKDSVKHICGQLAPELQPTCREASEIRTLFATDTILTTFPL